MNKTSEDDKHQLWKRFKMTGLSRNGIITSVTLIGWFILSVRFPQTNMWILKIAICLFTISVVLFILTYEKDMTIRGIRQFWFDEYSSIHGLQKKRNSDHDNTS